VVECLTEGAGVLKAIALPAGSADRTNYLGDPSHEAMLEDLNRRHAVRFVHPPELPRPTLPGMPAFAADFLLDTTRAVYQRSALPGLIESFWQRLAICT
jgi:hypothetical protein